MKRILVLLMCSLLFCAGCGETTVIINSENTDEIHNNVLGVKSLIELGGGLYYDTTTNIVYWWNGKIATSQASTPTAYYAPNGKPYLYNPKTNTLEMIRN